MKESNYHKTLKRELKGDISFKQFEEIKGNIPECDILICGVSSFGVEWFAENVIPALKSGQRVLAITKGLHENADGTLSPFPIWFSSLRPDVSFNAVGGPCISFELADRIHTEVAFCGKDKDILNELRAALKTEYYHISVTDDIAGIETAVALKSLSHGGKSCNRLRIQKMTRHYPKNTMRRQDCFMRRRVKCAL